MPALRWGDLKSECVVSEFSVTRRFYGIYNPFFSGNDKRMMRVDATSFQIRFGQLTTFHGTLLKCSTAKS